MRFKCPKCETDMDLTEKAHACPECEHEITLEEATSLFDAGELVGVVDESELGDIEDKDTIIVTDISEDISALVEGEDMSEAFVEKATVIFEAAVASRVKAETATLEESYDNKLVEAEAALVEKVDGYLDHVVSEWMVENDLEIESGIKSEMNESFAAGIAELLKEHFISAPEDRWDIVEGLADKVESLEAKLDEEMEKGIKIKQQMFEAEKEAMFGTLVEGLADTQVEKLKGMVETVEANSIDEYVTKVTTLKESYFKTKSEKDATNEDVIDDQKVIDENSDSLQEAIRMLAEKR